MYVSVYVHIQICMHIFICTYIEHVLYASVLHAPCRFVLVFSVSVQRSVQWCSLFWARSSYSRARILRCNSAQIWAQISDVSTASGSRQLKLDG